MFFGILTLIVGLAISGVAAWYSIVGLMAIFAAAKIPIAIMGAVLEVGKQLLGCISFGIKQIHYLNHILQ